MGNQMDYIRALGFVVLALGFICPGMAVGQKYPTKPVRLIINYPPGSGSDIVMRLVAVKLGSALGQQVVVENRGELRVTSALKS